MAERKQLWPMKDQERAKLREILQEEKAKASERDEVKKYFDEVDHRVKYLVSICTPFSCS